MTRDKNHTESPATPPLAPPAPHQQAAAREASASGRCGGRWISGRGLDSERMRDWLGFSASALFHCILLVVLAILLVKPDARREAQTLVFGPADAVETDIEWVELVAENPVAIAAESLATAADQQPLEFSEQLDVTAPVHNLRAGGLTSRPSLRNSDLPLNDLMLVSEAPVGGGFEGRTAAERARLVAERGGTAASETAVELGLAWLAAHQWQDGGWRLEHQAGPCDGRCRNPGLVDSETAIGATGLALLPFLGAGYTHLQGKYRDVVGNGLAFLKKQMKVTNAGGDLSWDTFRVGMYAQGIAALAFCEAYAMTGDESLLSYAQPAIRFICEAQGPRGGWRYKPGEPGDTTVTGWQVMALKSARLGQLFVPAETTENAKVFLNTMQDGGGAFYGYLTPVKQPGPTAVGLLLRMYLGWTRQDERLQRGVNYLAYLGPSKSDMYFNYYATQVLHHVGGNQWPKWNSTMRDYLVMTQAKTGHELGSWFFTDLHGSAAGRHYTTAICTMILEVYYRHLPLYGERAVAELPEMPAMKDAR